MLRGLSPERAETLLDFISINFYFPHSKEWTISTGTALTTSGGICGLQLLNKILAALARNRSGNPRDSGELIGIRKIRNGALISASIGKKFTSAFSRRKKTLLGLLTAPPLRISESSPL